MLNLPTPVRILLYTQPTDMRKGFDSLAAVVREQLGEDLLSGHLFESPRDSPILLGQLS
jgi:hypothetical protein